MGTAYLVMSEPTVLDEITNNIAKLINYAERQGVFIESIEIHAPPYLADILQEQVGAQLSMLPLEVKIVSNDGIDEVKKGDSAYSSDIEVRPVLTNDKT